MATRASATSSGRFARPRIPVLHNGDHLSRAEFVRRCAQPPENVKVELIDGVVYLGEAGGLAHGTRQAQLSVLLGVYQEATPGVEAAFNAGLSLGEWSCPQADLCLRIAGKGARCRPDADGRLSGPPELVIEVAYNAESIELHAKKDDYRRAGVQEYVVVCVEDERIRGFDLAGRRDRAPDRDGVYRTQTFPGLWLDAAAVPACDTGTALDVLRRGLDAAEHRGFVKQLKSRRARK